MSECKADLSRSWRVRRCETHITSTTQDHYYGVTRQPRVRTCLRWSRQHHHFMRRSSAWWYDEGIVSVFIMTDHGWAQHSQAWTSQMDKYGAALKESWVQGQLSQHQRDTYLSSYYVSIKRTTVCQSRYWFICPTPGRCLPIVQCGVRARCLPNVQCTVTARARLSVITRTQSRGGSQTVVLSCHHDIITVVSWPTCHGQWWTRDWFWLWALISVSMLPKLSSAVSQ